MTKCKKTPDNLKIFHKRAVILEVKKSTGIRDLKEMEAKLVYGSMHGSFSRHQDHSRSTHDET